VPTSRPAKRWTVGALAKQAGVSPGILRHYDALGLLRPTATTTAGYRLYSEHDRARLELIRALRALDFDLETIGRLLARRASVRAAAELHLRALELQARVIGRRRAVLRVLLSGSAPASAERLARLQVLSDFEQRERARFLAAQLARRMRGASGQAMQQAVHMAATVDLPESPTDAQVEAWLELAELVSDPGFLARHRGRAASRDDRDAAAWMRDMDALYGPAAAAVRDGVRCTSARGRAIVRRWLRAIARSRGLPQRRDVRVVARTLVREIDAHRDPREERFWQLVGVLKPEVARSAVSVAWPWLMTGVRALAE
jgi:DNA-binding transcriptional MerR regulator